MQYCQRKALGGVGGVSRAITLFLLLLVASMALPSAAAAQEAPPIVPGQQQEGNPLVFGIASHAWWLDPLVYGNQLFPALEDLGVTTVRVSIDWRRFEATEGVYDFSLYDRVFGELAARNIVIVADFNTIPPWASTDEAGCADTALEIYACQLREDKYAAYEAAVRVALTRYAWIQYWEFWNEPEMWRYLGEDATVYLRHLRTFYDIAHQINPEVVVAANTLVGVEYMEYVYNLSDAFYGVGNTPWDAIAIHPYNWNFTPGEGVRPLEINYDRVIALHDLQKRRGDGDQKIWITEYGWNNAPEDQARNLLVALDWMKRQPYIQFAHLHMLHDWNEVPLDFFGLMRIVPDAYGVPRLTPETRFEPKQPFYDAFKYASRAGLPNRPADSATTLTFPNTGHTVSGRFLKAWHERGGLRVLGEPLTRPYPRLQDGRWLLVQDFERARMEYHPEFQGTPAEVLLTLAGNIATAGRRNEPPFQRLLACSPTPDYDCYPETGHTLGYGFREFWNTRGGLATFGYPISEEFWEGGYVVQYFERARFEFHPENAGTEYVVLLGLLVRDSLTAEGWLYPNSVEATHPLLPTAREFGR